MAQTEVLAMHDEEINVKIVKVDAKLKSYRNECDTVLKTVKLNNRHMHEVKKRIEEIHLRNNELDKSVETTVAKLEERVGHAKFQGLVNEVDMLNKRLTFDE